MEGEREGWREGRRCMHMGTVELFSQLPLKGGNGGPELG